MTSAVRKSRDELKALANEFLVSHRLGIIGAGRRDGSPQLSVVSYTFNDGHVVIATGSDTAKYKNIRRNPRVSLAVYDGPICVVVYGQARLLQGDEADVYLGHPMLQPRAPGTPTLIVFPATTYRWARLEG